MKIANLSSYKFLNFQVSNLCFTHIWNVLEPPHWNLQWFNYNAWRQFLPQNSKYFTTWLALCEKCSNTEFFLVRIRENMDQKRLHIWRLLTQTGTFIPKQNTFFEYPPSSILIFSCFKMLLLIVLKIRNTYTILYFTPWLMYLFVSSLLFWMLLARYIFLVFY